MSRKSFVVAVDSRDAAVTPAAMRNAIVENPDVIDWWNHIPGIFLVLSDKSADALSASIYSRAGIRRFLVVEANLSESEGLLPDAAWDWIQERSPADSHSGM